MTTLMVVGVTAMVTATTINTMKQLTQQEFLDWYESVQYSLRVNKQWRLGQAMFNTLRIRHPELANHVRASDKDPFYNNTKIPAFLWEICSAEAYTAVPKEWLEADRHNTY